MIFLLLTRNATCIREAVKKIVCGGAKMLKSGASVSPATDAFVDVFGEACRQRLAG
jgi:hypothetical protein